MVDLKHITEKGSKRCYICRDKHKLNIPTPSCVGKNFQCNNQLLRQKCKNVWNEAIKIANEKSPQEAIIYLNIESKKMEGWFI